MEPSRDEILFATLESLRPAPRPGFAAELDARVAAGFPRESAPPAPLSRLAAWAGNLRLRQLALSGSGAVLAVVAIVAVVIVAGNSGSGSGGADNEVAVNSFGAAGSGKHSGANGSLNQGGSGVESSSVEYETEVPTVGGSKASAGTAASTEASTNSIEFLGEKPPRNSGPYASQAHDRDVEYAAEMVLGTKPEDVGDAAGKVFEAVHQYGGIVLDSSVSGGSEGDAGAKFELLVPSAKLGDALAAFSGIADVRSRHETSNDITAPTVTTTELLQDSHARIESLLNELAETETETEREVVEAKLRGERRHAAVLKSSLTNLQRRASLSHVSLRIESGASDSSSGAGGWDVGDAFHDAGKILAAAAGVAIVVLAVLAPIALIALLIWLGNRAWVRQRRERALG